MFADLTLSIKSKYGKARAIIINWNIDSRKQSKAAKNIRIYRFLEKKEKNSENSLKLKIIIW